MLSHSAKIFLSFALSLIAVILAFFLKGRERKFWCFAMLSSTLGDLFMTDTFGMGDVSTYPGAAFFIIAHILYIVCFAGASKKNGYRIKNRGLAAGIAVSLIAVIALTVLMFIKTGKVQGMYFPLLIYLAIIGVNLCIQYSYAVNEKGLRYFLIAGMTLFLISDFTVFLPMLNISPEYNDFVWATYVPAQLLCIIFNSDLKRND